MLTIIFEGVDKAGKTSLMKEFNKVSNFKHVCIDRAYISHYIYGIDRSSEVDNLVRLSVLTNTMNNIPGLIIVYVEASEKCIALRCLQSNEPKFNIKVDLERFSTVIEATKMLCPEVPIITINTSLHHVETCASSLLETITRIEKDYDIQI